MRPRSLKSQRNKRAGKSAMDEWRAARFRCQLCHRPADDYSRQWGYFEAHRIIRGKAYDTRNTLFLCGSFFDTRCHDLFESHRIRNASGELLPHLGIAEALFVKREDEPDLYDELYLADLLGKRLLPAPMELPECFLNLRDFWSP